MKANFDLTSQDYFVAEETFIKSNPFATVMASIEGDIKSTQLPICYCPKRHVLLSHFARNNELAEAFGHKCKVLFSGTDAYISPRWTEGLPVNDVVVPTWNYSALEISGSLELISDETEKVEIMAQIVSQFEGEAVNPWRIEELKPSLLGQMLKAIHVFQISIEHYKTTHKWSQNKSAQTQHVMREQVQAQLLTKYKTELGLNHI